MPTRPLAATSTGSTIPSGAIPPATSQARLSSKNMPPNEPMPFHFSEASPDDDGALERRREEHRGGMRAVVRAMLDRADIVQVLLQLRRDRQLVLHEFRDALVEDVARARPVVDHLV